MCAEITPFSRADDTTLKAAWAWAATDVARLNFGRTNSPDRLTEKWEEPSQLSLLSPGSIRSHSHSFVSAVDDRWHETCPISFYRACFNIVRALHTSCQRGSDWDLWFNKWAPCWRLKILAVLHSCPSVKFLSVSTGFQKQITVVSVGAGWHGQIKL